MSFLNNHWIIKQMNLYNTVQCTFDSHFMSFVLMLQELGSWLCFPEGRRWTSVKVFSAVQSRCELWLAIVVHNLLKTKIEAIFYVRCDVMWWTRMYVQLCLINQASLSSMINGLQKHLHIDLYCILPIIYLYWDMFCKDGYHCTGHIVSLE